MCWRYTADSMTRSAFLLAALSLSALLAGCTTTTAPNHSTFTLQGVSTGVAFPDSVLYLASGDETNLDNVGSIGPSGAFKLKATVAPAASSAFDLLTVPSGCTVTGSAQAHPMVHFYDRLVVNTPQGDPLGSIKEIIVTGATLPFGQAARVYSDRAAVLRATVQCGTAAQRNYDVSLVRGWNAVEYSVASNSVTMKTLGKVTTTFNAERALPYISVVFAPSTLTFTSNSTFEVSATFYQEDGLGGTFPLSTDVDGLSVEPAEVTLEGIAVLAARPGAGLLRHLGLRAQALTIPLKFTYSGTVNGTRPFVLTLNSDYGEQVGRGDGFLDVRRP